MNVLAFDFGASGGRAVLGRYDGGKITLEELHRFENGPVMRDGSLYWDLNKLFSEIKHGLVKAEKYGYESIGIDTWGVDGAFVANDGAVLADPYCYRDGRTAATPDAVRALMSDGELYRRSGIQLMDFNTLYQLYETKRSQSELYALANKFVLMPELFGYLLTGNIYAEKSMASTTQLLEPHTKEWNFALIEELGLKSDLFPALLSPGTEVGTVKAEICEELGIKPKKLIAVCGHDTASAVAGVPAVAKDFAYISCGTWSLFGTELDEPRIDEVSMRFNMTNETGYGDTTRFLKNIIGLWLIQETRRQFRREGKDYSYADMESMAKQSQAFRCFIDPDDPRFVPPGDQPERIRSFCRETGQYVPQTDGEIVRCIYESLAMKYRYTFERLKQCVGHSFDTVHMVGGGVKDEFLCRLTADAAKVRVTAGPIEATAVGNIVVQLIANGAIPDLSSARRAIAASFCVKHYSPSNALFDENYGRFKAILR